MKYDVEFCQQIRVSEDTKRECLTRVSEILFLATKARNYGLLSLGKEEEVRETADQLYVKLREAGFTVYYDDRDASAGVKFKDADLIGIPLRVTVGARGLAQGTVEVKRRSSDERLTVPLEQLVEYLQTA